MELKNISIAKLLKLKLDRKIAKGQLTEEEAMHMIETASKMYAIDQITDEDLEEIVVKATENIID